MNDGHYLFDLDGTIAKYHGWQGEEHIGDPIPSMIQMIKLLLERGKTVKIFTARAADENPVAIKAIEKWCKEHIGRVLEITCKKDYQTILIFDDRAVTVEENTGRLIGLRKEMDRKLFS